MLAKSLKYVSVLIFVATLSIPAFAKSIERRITVEPQSITIVAGTTLKPGDYLFRVDGDKLVVEEINHKVVAQATGKWEPRDSKWDGDELVLGPNGNLQEVRMSGEKGTFIVSGS